MLAKQARRVLNLLDDTPIVPGDTAPAFENQEAARQILNEAEEELRNWSPNLEEVSTQSGALGTSNASSELVECVKYAMSSRVFSHTTQMNQLLMLVY